MNFFSIDTESSAAQRVYIGGLSTWVFLVSMPCARLFYLSVCWRGSLTKASYNRLLQICEGMMAMPMCSITGSISFENAHMLKLIVYREKEYKKA